MQLIEAPVVGTEEFRSWSEWLGHRLAEHGPAAVEPHLAELAAAALERDVATDEARLLADDRQPGLVRARAFFAVVMALDEIG